jgi:hypothetical protein
MEIINVSNTSKLIRVKLGEIKPNRFRDLERWPVEREVIDGLKAAFEKEGFWSKSVQGILNEKNEVELRFGHHRVIAATEYFGADHEVEIDLVEYRGDNSMFQAMKLENSVNRNKIKVANELIDQSMHWLDDVVFEQYPTWEACEQAQKNLGLDLQEYFGKIDENGKANYSQCVEYGVGEGTLEKHTGCKLADIREYLKSNFTIRRKRGMEKRAERDRKIAEEKRAEQARLKAEQDEANRIRREEEAEAKLIEEENRKAIAEKKRLAKAAKDEAERQKRLAEQEELERIRQENAEIQKANLERHRKEEAERKEREAKLAEERKKAEKGAKVVEVGEWYDARASEVFDVPAHSKAFREEVSKDDVRPFLQTEMLVPFAQAIRERLENDAKLLGRQMLTDSNIRCSVHEFFMDFKNTMKIQAREVQAKEEKDNPNLKLIRLLEKAVTDGNRFSGTLADIESCMKANGFTAVDGPSAGQFMDVLSKVIARSAFFNPRKYQ